MLGTVIRNYELGNVINNITIIRTSLKTCGNIREMKHEDVSGRRRNSKLTEIVTWRYLSRCSILKYYVKFTHGRREEEKVVGDQCAEDGIFIMISISDQISVWQLYHK